MTFEKTISRSDKIAYLFFIQGAYYLLTGMWPIIDIHSFMVLTGPKIDEWLVKTVGMIIFMVGAGFITASVRRSANWPLIIMAMGTAFGFIIVDVNYTLKGIISAIYLLDATVQSVLLIFWSVALTRLYREKKAEETEGISEPDAF